MCNDRLLIRTGSTLSLLVTVVLFGAGCDGPIPDGVGIRLVPRFLGGPADSRPLPPKNVVPHPLLSPVSSIHSDSYNSDVDDFPAPLGIRPVVRTRFIGMCPIIMFDGLGTLVAVSFDSSVIGMGVTAMNPDTLEVIDRYAIPIDFGKLLTGCPGPRGICVNGAYFHLDAQGKAIVGTQDNLFLELELSPQAEGPRRWTVIRSIDLQPYLSDSDVLIDTQYDWDGHIWFVSCEGVVGYIDAVDQSVHTTQLVGEFIENGVAIAEDGVYILTSAALYRFEIHETTLEPTYSYCIPYDAGTVPKPGTFALGSGATPTLLGDDLITFTDNADDRVHLLVYRRGKDVTGDRLVGSVPLFEWGGSAVDVSMIGYGDSIIVENIYGAGGFMSDYRDLRPGLTRVDVREDRSGCDIVWTSDVRSTTVPKLSTQTGLIYTYTQLVDWPEPVDAWYFTAIDFQTGQVVYQVLAGTGFFKTNAFGGLAIGPNGTVYQGVLGGIISFRDGG